MNSLIRLEVEARKPFAGSLSFGDVGAYERLYGRVHFAIDADDASNATIVDLDKAPRNDSSLVEYSIDLYVLRPVDLERGNRRLIYDVNNRGNKRILQYFNDGVHSNHPSDVGHAGNGFLMRRGYSIVWSGWQGDLIPDGDLLTMTLPVATDDGEELTGVVRSEFVADEPGIVSYPLSTNGYTASHETVSLDTASATLTYREYERDERIPISPDQWQFARPGPDGEPVPSAEDIYLAAGFRPGWIYELVYTAKNPRVMGLGFTGVRDLVSFLLHADTDSNGASNPLKHDSVAIQKAYAWGRSQSGRFLREFVYRGFNVDGDGRRVFDAMSPHVSGGGRIILNYRFAQPGRYPRQHADHLYPSDQFPFAYRVVKDPHTGKEDGILKRPETDPLIIHTQTSSEYWERRGSLVHTDPLGNDLDGHENARVFLFAGSQHGADPLKGPEYGIHRHPSNPLNTTPLLRALLDALDRWATDGTSPPDSLVPTRSSESAVPAEVAADRFPTLRDVRCPVEASRLFVQDHGAKFDEGILSREPPEEDIAREYAVLVSLTDGDGNEVAGIRTPDVEVPLATYTGWNFRVEGPGDAALAGLTGSFLPMPSSEAERMARGDSRPSLRERYRSSEDYVEAVEAAARKLVGRRLLLEEDAERYVEKARRRPPL